MNLREQLTSEDNVKSSERWLVLDLPGSNASKFMSDAGLTAGGPYAPPSLERNVSSNNNLDRVEDKTEEASEVSQPKAEPEPASMPVSLPVSDARTTKLLCCGSKARSTFSL